MKIKEHTLIILLLFLMLFICIGSVSALENQTNNHGGNEVISVSESQEILTAGEGAYSDVRDDIGSGENISLIKSNDCYTGSAGDIIGIMNPDVIDGQTLATTVTEPIDIWYVNVTAASGGDGKSAETAFNTVNDAINAAHDGNTIMIASGTYTGNYNIGLNVGKNLNFIKYGDGEAIFDAEEKSRIWTVNASSINITGLTFKNGKSRYGGAICFENAISNSVINGIFIDNYVQNYTDDSVFYAKGGAIYFAAMVDNCIINGSFINNSVKMNDYLTFYGDGGAIYFADMVSNSIFDGNYTNNVVHNDGGSLYFNDTVTNSFFAGNFSENFAFQHGSCIYINKNVKNTTFQCTSTENVAVSGSFTFNGGINDCDFNMKITDDGTDHGMLSFLKYTVNNTTFNGTYIKNEAQNGAVYYFEGNVTNCKFNGTYTNNFAFTHGGVFYFIETITNCTIDGIFDENTAQADGGVIYIEEYAQDCIINGTYNNNKAQYGGAFYLMDGAKNCTIDGNYTNNNALYGGVSIINGAQNCTIKGQYNNNTCENLGGAHYFKENVENTTITGTYTNNKAQEQNGGALYFKYNLTNSTINGIFINNTANNGCAIYIAGMVDNCIINGSFINNTVKLDENLTLHGDGGAIYIAGMVNNTIFDGTFTHNVVYNDGGSLYFNDTVTNSFFAGNFSENFAFQHGSCIYINKNVKNTTFQCTSTENVAVSGSFTFNGGINDCDFNMIIIEDETDHGMLSFLKYTVNNTTFNGTYIKNEAQNGAVYYFEGNVTNCKFNGTYTNNFAFTHGGVFYFIETITNCTIDGIFDENTAQADGGVIYIEEYAQDCIINGTYNNNKAQYGGAFYLMDGAKNCTIDGNYTNNNALYGGVSIINGAQNCTIKGQYNNNTCENLGGAHYFKENVENTTITGTYTNNKAKEQNGGALYFKYNLTNSTINGIFINNTANNGSAVYFTNNIENSTISGKYINNTGNDVIHIMKANMNNIVHDSIFINNNNNILSVESGKLQSVNNWFGNNATNYNEKPEAVNVDMDNWLFLNATSNPDEVTVGSTSVITFKLESYNETSNKISNYDGSKMDIILDLSSTLGSLNQTTALINEEILYTPSKKGNASITGKFENAYDTLCLINILNAPMNVTADNITEGENATINVELPSDATGNVSTDINGKTYSSEVKDGNAIITIPDLLKGDYTLPITYSGDEKYNPLTKDVNITVEGGKVIVSAPDLVKYYSAPERFVVNVTYAKGSPAANKAVNITINGVTYKRTTNENGTASLGINFNSGEYPVIVAVDDVIVNSTVTVKATIYASDIVKVFRNGTQYYATFTDANGTPIANTTVSFNINGVFYNRTTNGNGTAKLNINLMAGDYILTATNPITGEMKSNSIKVISLIESNDLTKYYRNASQFVVRIHSADGGYVGAGEEVKFNINGVFYTRTTNATGHAKLNINLGQGNYTITTYHKDCSQGNQITVLPVLSADDLVMKYRDGSQFKAKLVDGQGKAYAEQRVQFNINGVLYYRTTGSDGIAKLNINLMSGEYIITSSYNGFNIANKITIRG